MNRRVRMSLINSEIIEEDVNRIGIKLIIKLK
jgi:hypothetical protein